MSINYLYNYIYKFLKKYLYYNLQKEKNLSTFFLLIKLYPNHHKKNYLSKDTSNYWNWWVTIAIATQFSNVQLTPTYEKRSCCGGPYIYTNNNTKNTKIISNQNPH